MWKLENNNAVEILDVKKVYGIIAKFPYKAPISYKLVIGQEYLENPEFIETVTGNGIVYSFFTEQSNVNSLEILGVIFTSVNKEIIDLLPGEFSYIKESNLISFCVLS